MLARLQTCLSIITGFMSNVIVQNDYQAHPTPIYVVLQNLKDQTGAG